MALAELIDVASLVQPFGGENPAGNEIREDVSPKSPYQMIKSARQGARAAERNSLFDESSNEAVDHWHKVLNLAPDILSGQSKDLEVASWYTEALVRIHGFSGLRCGFELIAQLIDGFWDNLYPQPDEDGVATRVAPLAGLNGEGAEGVLIAPIRNVPITQGNPPGPFSLWQYQQARDVQKISDENARAEKAAKVGFLVEDINNAVNESSEAFYVDLRDEIKTCIDIYQKISRSLTERCGTHDAPPTGNITSALDECLSTINHIAGHKFPVEESKDEENEATENEGGAATTTAAKGPIASREQAFKQLRTIAHFFRQTEPHSPISYVLDKAVQWGGMSLNELILELIPDAASREHYSILTGVRVDDNN